MTTALTINLSDPIYSKSRSSETPHLLDPQSHITAHNTPPLLSSDLNFMNESQWIKDRHVKTNEWSWMCFCFWHSYLFSLFFLHVRGKQKDVFKIKSWMIRKMYSSKKKSWDWHHKKCFIIKLIKKIICISCILISLLTTLDNLSSHLKTEIEAIKSYLVFFFEC